MEDNSRQTSTTVEPIVCEPWCEIGDGHPDEGCREDQGCFGFEHRVYLSAEPLVPMTDLTTTWREQDYLNAYLMRLGADAPTRVCVGHGEKLGQTLTFDEARRFAHAILDVVGGHEETPVTLMPPDAT
ncbi:MAG: hypothetical protein ABI662_09510 [Dermatophilaceae bacterium]